MVKLPVKLLLSVFAPAPVKMTRFVLSKAWQAFKTSWSHFKPWRTVSDLATAQEKKDVEAGRLCSWELQSRVILRAHEENKRNEEDPTLSISWAFLKTLELAQEHLNGENGDCAACQNAALETSNAP